MEGQLLIHFLATSAQTIAQYFENHIKADYAYVVMAKPLVDKVPFFVHAFMVPIIDSNIVMLLLGGKWLQRWE